MTPLVEVNNLNYSFRQGEFQMPVLKQVSLKLYPGEIVIMKGPSGSGKTTFLTLIGGLRSAHAGSIKVFGQELVNSSEARRIAVRRQTGYIFQLHNLLPALTALENVAMALELDNPGNERQRHAKAADMLAAVGLGQRLQHKPEQLSGGERQRVSIARALVRHPKMILADEPTSALDKQSGQDAVDRLHDLAKDTGTTILLVTHDERILDSADRIVTLDDGVLQSS
ncbi:MAG: ATP-binding cassette domain-containing protein [Methylococcales bacterium]|nr:ATP-binding cassette domain-containing protein [Methylococcales bacterium]